MGQSFHPEVWNNHPVVAQKSQHHEKAMIMKRFLRRMEFVPPDINGTNEQLEALMRSEMEEQKIGCEQLERTLHLAASLIELAYNDCSLSEKKNMALLNWYLIYVDDMAGKDPFPFTQFEQRFLRGQPQLNPVLDELAKLIPHMWEQYDPHSANSIVSATFDYITSTCIEPEIERLPVLRGVERFPLFVRERTGVATAFSLMIFTQSARFTYMDVIQAIPDMNFWINLTNDLLSFHKEDIDGETTNYVCNRAYVDDQTPLQILAKITDELSVARKNIYVALERQPSALKAWQTFERGYIGWHLAQKRYKLKELGL